MMLQARDAPTAHAAGPQAGPGRGVGDTSPRDKEILGAEE